MLMMPLYEQVKQEILKRITNQQWNPGDSLPNEFELADELGVSQGTVRKALNILTDEKILERRQGKGTFVAKVDFDRFWKFKTTNGVDKIEYTQFISVEQTDIPAHLQDVFGKRQSTCITVKRLHHMGGDSVLYKLAHIPMTTLKGFDDTGDINKMRDYLDEHFTTLFHNSLYTENHFLKAELPNEECQQHLRIPADKPVLVQEYSLTDVSGNVAIYGYIYCDSDRVFYEDIVS